MDLNLTWLDWSQIACEIVVAASAAWYITDRMAATVLKGEDRAETSASQAVPGAADLLQASLEPVWVPLERGWVAIRNRLSASQHSSTDVFRTSLLIGAAAVYWPSGVLLLGLYVPVAVARFAISNDNDTRLRILVVFGTLALGLEYWEFARMGAQSFSPSLPRKFEPNVV
jgi:hypothetical protein